MRPRSASRGRTVGARPRVPTLDGEWGFEVAGVDGIVITRPGLGDGSVLEYGLHEAAARRPGKEVPDDVIGPGVLVHLSAVLDVPDQGIKGFEAESPLDEPLAGLDRTRGGLSLVAGGFPLVAEVLGGAAQADDGEGDGIFALEDFYLASDPAERHGVFSSGYWLGRRGARLCAPTGFGGIFGGLVPEILFLRSFPPISGQIGAVSGWAFDRLRASGKWATKISKYPLFSTHIRRFRVGCGLTGRRRKTRAIGLVPTLRHKLHVASMAVCTWLGTP